MVAVKPIADDASTIDPTTVDHVSRTFSSTVTQAPAIGTSSRLGSLIIPSLNITTNAGVLELKRFATVDLLIHKD